MRKLLVLAALVVLLASSAMGAGTLSFSNFVPAAGATSNTTLPTISFKVTASADTNISAQGNYTPSARLLGSGDTVIADYNGSALTKEGNNQQATYSVTVDTDLTDQTYTVVVRAHTTDLNQFSKGWNFTVQATGAAAGPTNPKVTIKDHAGFTNETKPELALSADGSPTKFKIACNETDWTNEIDFKATYEDFNIASGNNSCTTSEGEKKLFVQFKDAAGNWSASANDTTIYDVTKPGKPVLTLSLRQSDGAVKVEWDAINDNLSNIWGYDIYRGDDGNSSSSKLLQQLEKDAFYFDKEVLPNKKYFYWVEAVDNAGNKSGKSDFASIETGEVSAETDAVDANATVSDEAGVGKEITITILNQAGQKSSVVGLGTITLKSAFGRTMNNVNLEIKLPNNQTRRLISLTDPESSDNRTGFEVPFEVTSDMGEGEAQILFRGKEKATDKEFFEVVKFTVDASTPSIAWVKPKEGDTLKPGDTLSVRAEDEGGVGQVVFSYKDLRSGKSGDIGVATSSDDAVYGVAWNAKDLNNGDYSLSATVVDKGGNKATALVKSVRLSGAVDPEKDIAEGIVSQAESRLGELDARKEELFRWNVASTKFKEASEGIAAKVAEAKSSLQAKSYGKAKKDAEDALAGLDNLANVVAVSEYRTESSVFLLSELEEAFAGAGLPQEVADEAAKNVSRNKIQRTLKAAQVKDGTKTYYQLNVELALRFNGEEGKDYVLIEFVPKAFAKDASSIKSNQTFSILEEDPVIKFALDGLNAGDEHVIVYSLADALEEGQVDAMLDANVLGMFSVPPLMVEETVDMGGFGAKPVDVGGLLGIVVLLVVVGAGAFVFMQIRSGQLDVSGVQKQLQAFVERVQASLPATGKTRAREGADEKGARHTHGDGLVEDEERGVIRFKEEEEVQVHARDMRRFKPLDLSPRAPEEDEWQPAREPAAHAEMPARPDAKRKELKAFSWSKKPEKTPKPLAAPEPPPRKKKGKWGHEHAADDA